MRWLFVVVAVFGGAFSIAAYAYRAHFWAVGVTAAIVAAAMLVLFHSLAYLALSGLSRLLELSRGKRGRHSE